VSRLSYLNTNTKVTTTVPYARSNYLPMITTSSGAIVVGIGVVVGTKIQK